MSKLVRDGSKEHVEKHDPKVVFRQRTENERFQLLLQKFLEELGEYLVAEGREQKLKELGDLTEIVWAMAESDEITPMEVAAQAAAKQMLRGKFDSLWVMEVELDTDRPKQSLASSTSAPIKREPWEYQEFRSYGYSG